MTKDEALQLAAQAWCKPETEHLDIIPELADAFAQIIWDLMTVGGGE